MTEEQRKNVKNAIERAITHIARKWGVRNDDVLGVMRDIIPPLSDGYTISATSHGTAVAKPKEVRNPYTNEMIKTFE